MKLKGLRYLNPKISKKFEFSETQKYGYILLRNRSLVHFNAFSLYRTSHELRNNLNSQETVLFYSLL